MRATVVLSVVAVNTAALAFAFWGVFEPHPTALPEDVSLGTEQAGVPLIVSSAPPRSALPNIASQQPWFVQREGRCNTSCAKQFQDTASNAFFASTLTTVLGSMNLSWWLDEGGLIGVTRGGALRSADDDFDFFAMLPGQETKTTRCFRHAPQSPLLQPCTQKEFDKEMHSFLLKFWEAGLCVNNFDPDFEKFEAKGRLMWSLMGDRKKVRQPNQRNPGKRCYDHKGLFAHMHLGLLSEDGDKVMTNVWSHHHPRDALPLHILLPTRECMGGNQVVPCPANPVAYLSQRNNREYTHSKSDGSCLLIRKKWGRERREATAAGVEVLHKCGCASLYPLLEKLRQSNYQSC